MFNPHSLTHAQSMAISKRIRQDSIDYVGYYQSLFDEALGDAGFCEFGVIRRGEVFHVWSLDDTVGLVYGGSFRTRLQAETHTHKWAEEVLQAAEDWLETLKDEAR